MVAIIFNLMEFTNMQQKVSWELIRAKKDLDKWAVTLTLIASTVDEYPSTEQLIK